MAYEMIRYEKAGPVLTLTLNRPETINAINPQMTAEVHTALDEGRGAIAVDWLIEVGE